MVKALTIAVDAGIACAGQVGEWTVDDVAAIVAVIYPALEPDDLLKKAMLAAFEASLMEFER